MVAKLGVLEVAYGDIFRYFRRYAMIVVLVTSLRAYAALARSYRADSELTGQYVSLSFTLHDRTVRSVGRVQLLVDNG